jgi:hypothetical protein
MRSAEWLFGVSAALFVFGIGFVVVGARSARQPTVASRPTAPRLVPVASVRQIMKSIVTPGATAIFESVSTTVTIEGTTEKAPKTGAEWAAVANGAAALAEAGNMLLLEGRALDGDWVKMSYAMIDAAKLTLAAVEARNPQQVFDAGGEVYNSCNGCHAQYMR